MAYKFYNPHPKGLKVGDCVKRAFTKALNIEYKEVAKELNALKKVTKAKKFNENKNWKKYCEVKGMTKITFQATKGEKRMNGARFCKAHPKGTYVLRMAKHVVACVDGVLYDTWNSSKKCVYIAYKVN